MKDQTGTARMDIPAVFFAPVPAQDTTPEYLTICFPEVGLDRMREALTEGRYIGARITIYCDTREQVEAVALHVGRLLPRHRRIPYEMGAADVWDARLT